MSTPQIRRARRRFLAEWIFLSAFLLILAATLSLSLFQDYQRTGLLERERLATQTEIVEKNLIPQLFAANRALEGLMDDLLRMDRGDDRLAVSPRRLQSICDMLIGVRTLMVIDATGMVLASNKHELVGQNLGMRGYFQLAKKEMQSQTLYVTPPFTTVLNTFVVNLVRMRPHPQGGFGGIVVATLDPDQFKVLLDSVRHTPDTSSSIIHGAGKVFLQLPDPADAAPAVGAVDPLFVRHQQTGQTHSVLTGVSPVTGQELLVSARSIQSALLNMDQPLVVSVARPLEMIYAAWRVDALRTFVLLALLLAGSTAGLYFYQRRQRSFDRLARAQERERLASDTALRESERRFQELSAMSSDWFWQQDEQFRFTEFSGAFSSAFTPPAASLGKTRWELNIQLTPQQWAAHRAQLEARLPFKNFEYPIFDAGGEMRWYSVNGEPRFDAQGRFIGYQGTGRNITAQKLAEQELRVAATAFESQEGMLVTDAHNVILRVNRAFTAMTGYSTDEAVGQTPRLLKSGRHDGAYYQAMWGSILDQGVWQGEIWNRRKNGEIFPVWQIITSVKNSEGTVTHFVATQTDITQRIAAQAEIENLAFFDPLTRLPNRRLLMDRLQHALAASRRTQRHAALLFIDLDNFKTLNDTLGHNVGDLLLQQVAQRLTACVREGDTVARLGGDEFVVMLENLSEKAPDAAAQTEGVGEKIHAALNLGYTLGTHPYHSTPSIGVALFHQQHESVDELLRQADMAMYQAKKSGRNTLRFFDPEMQRGIAARASLEADLRAGLALDQFLLHYQPQVDAQGQLTGAEALLRWQHPARGNVSPGEFIPLAEETGLIQPLGQWVLDAACAQLAAWSAQAPTAHLSVAVNISARQLHGKDFVAQVLSALARTGARAQRLKLELTESLLLNDVEDTIAKMTELKSHGVGFSLDDFGTGYSSLTYLKRLPLDQLKIDQSFVRDLLIDPNDAAIVCTIIALARSLGLAVIAEGVETEAQRSVLAQHGCTAYQGYLFGRPGPASALELVHTWTPS